MRSLERPIHRGVLDMRARFFFDIVCPYAYLASTQIERLSRETGVEIEWVPMLLGGVFRSIGAPQVPAAVMSPSKAKMNTLDLERWAQRWGVPFSFSKYHPQRSVEAMRLLCVTPQEHIPQVAGRIFTAYWSDQARLDESTLRAIAQEYSLSEVWESKADEAKRRLYEYTELAVSLGVFGAPALEVDGSLFWGQDRLELARLALGAPSTPFPKGQAPQGSYVELFHDFSSPFSYLGCQWAERLIHERGAQLIWRPILLGALFKSIGAPNIPLFTMSDSKRKYMLKDLNDWAARWEVPFSFPAHFPLRTVTALRLALIEPQLTLPLYRAAWAESRNIGEESVLRELLIASKLDPDEHLEKTKEPAIKDQLRANTEAAQAAGAFGAPSYVLHRPDEAPQLFWGQDRLELLCEALCAPSTMEPVE